ncbi:hypothetical protein GE09DRAFT_1152107 [Coniochaeta sp. 2T2.1]|nr:hypothetical protein GE09DRAFT_1152107 [Coniochaeta sp. 2T2.1]
MKSPQNLRLRLVVRRHNLPEVRVLFSISLREEPTIANLLEQVNDTVPLESPDWGLDDYAVEVEDPHNGRAFECLHFQAVDTILEKDEEVVIRPLFTVDRKKRLLSGREQISSDGRHLVDGVPFGRPRLRAPRGRPPVEIPPLKRRRIMFEDGEGDGLDEEEEDGEYREGEEEEDEEDEPLRLTQFGEDDDVEDPGAMRVAALFDDADNGEDQDAGTDEDEDEEEEDEEEIDEAELLDELRDIQMDNELLGDQSLNQEHEATPASPESPEPTADSDLSRLNKITALRRAFPAVDCHIYEDVLRRHNLSEEKAYRELHKSYEASMTLDQMKTLLASFSCPVLPSSNNFDAGAEDQEAESDAESTSSLVKRYDQHGFPSGSILDGSASRVAAEALRKAGHAVKSPVHVRFDDDSAEERSPDKKKSKGVASTGVQVESDSSESSDNDSDEESYKEASQEDDDSESDSDSDSNSSEEDSSDNSDASNDSDESGDSDKDSGPEVLSTKGTRKSPASQGPVQREPAAESSPSKKRKRGPGAQDPVDQEVSSSEESSDDSSDSSSESDESSSDESSDEVSKQLPTPSSTKAPVKSAPLPPTVTSKHFQHEPVSNAKRSAPGEGLSKTKLRNARRKLALKAKKAAAAAAARTSASPAVPSLVGEVTKETVQTDDSEFLKRKQALLEKLANNNAEPASCEPNDQSTTLQADTIMNGTEVASAQATPEQPLATDGVAETSSQRRSRLDVGAGRRMLFASLGLRNPKTKADEDKIRGDLMKGVRPLVNHRITETPATENGKTAEAENALAEPEEEEEDAQAWRSRINYRAVECVQEGIELSEPPFPFIQRWDPQQQNAWRDRRGGKGKRKQRNQTEFYEDDSTLPGAKKQRVNHVDHDDSFADESFAPDDSFAPETNGTRHEEAELNYDDILEVVSNKPATEQPSQRTDMDDLPSIPKDLTRLSPLTLDEAKPGMVITWKQMVFSKATNWAPQVLDLTAVIVSIDAASEELRVVLARRDRELDGKEKVFDEEGNRVYDRFDAPDDDEDDDTEGNTEGYRTIQHSDMTDPRIILTGRPATL